MKKQTIQKPETIEEKQQRVAVQIQSILEKEGLVWQVDHLIKIIPKRS